MVIPDAKLRPDDTPPCFYKDKPDVNEGISLCPVCRGTISPVRSWVGQCRACGFWASSLTSGGGADVGGLESLRRHNFKSLLDRLEPSRPGLRSGTILEVGCSQGLFLDEAASRGLSCVAIEPEAAAAAAAAKRGHAVITGFFPDACPPGQTFAAIVFNDVFEHLPDPAAAVGQCRSRLNADGLLIINLPSSGGIFFRIARALAALGIVSPFERLWQKGLSSPHLSYFSPATLKRFIEARGFEQVDQFSLDSLHATGLWRRLRATSSVLSASLMLPPLAVLSLMCRLLPPDIHVAVFRVSASSGAP